MREYSKSRLTKYAFIVLLVFIIVLFPYERDYVTDSREEVESRDSINYEIYDNLVLEIYDYNLYDYENTQEAVIVIKEKQLVENIKIEAFGGEIQNLKQKSFEVHFNNKIKNLFSKYAVDEIIIRTAGQDFLKGDIRNALAIELARGLDFEFSDYMIVNTFINGEYYGIHYVLEKLDNDYFKNRYGKTDVNIVEDYSKKYRGDKKLYKEFKKSYEEDDMDQIEISKYFDIESFIDYYAFQIFMANLDWNPNNLRIWNSDDKPYRWIMYDMDMSMSAVDYIPDLSSDIVYTSIMSEKKLKMEFLSRMMELLNNEFAYDHVAERIDDLVSGLGSDMKYHYNLYGRDQDEFMDNVVKLKIFFADRTKVIEEWIDEEMNNFGE